MPAVAESPPVPASLDKLTATSSLSMEKRPGLLTCLAMVTDPRDPQGWPHPLVGILDLYAAAVLTSATSLLAIGEWAADASQPSWPGSAPAATPSPAGTTPLPRPPSAEARPGQR